MLLYLEYIAYIEWGKIIVLENIANVSKPIIPVGQVYLEESNLTFTS